MRFLGRYSELRWRRDRGGVVGGRNRRLVCWILVLYLLRDLNLRLCRRLDCGTIRVLLRILARQLQFCNSIRIVSILRKLWPASRASLPMVENRWHCSSLVDHGV